MFVVCTEVRTYFRRGPRWGRRSKALFFLTFARFFVFFLRMSQIICTFAPNMKRVYAILLLLVAFSMSLWAQEKEMSVAERNAAQGFNDTIDRLAPDFVLVSLCVADPTDQSQDYLGMTGHAFLRLQSPTFGLDYCFSYENERIKGQLWDYLTGKLKMRMRMSPTEEYIEDYRIWERAVHEYLINLPPEAELRFWEQMDNHMMSEREMKLNLMKFGCTNTILQYVEHALAPDTITYNWPEKFLTKSAMEIADEHMEYYPWSLLGIRILEGKAFSRLRKPKQKVIFPADLLEVWSSSTINEQPTLTYVGDIVKAEPVVVEKPWFTPRLCGVILLVLIVGVVAFLLVRKCKK